jgi:hypothetical protein
MRAWQLVTIGVTVLVLGGVAQAELLQGQVTTVGHPMLSVSGSGIVQVAPDTLRVTASVITEGPTVAEAREQNARIVRRAMEAVKALKLSNVSTKTLNYTMERVTRDARVDVKADLAKLDLPWKAAITNLESSTFNISVPVTLGYRAANSATVRVQGVAREELSESAGKIVDALMAAGCNQITSVAYSLERDNSAAMPAMREALAKAVKDAQMTAEAVASAAGRKIVGIRSISPSYRVPESYRQVQALLSDRLEAAARTPTLYTAGMLEVTAQVQVSYELDYNRGDTEFLTAPGK